MIACRRKSLCALSLVTVVLLFASWLWIRYRCLPQSSDTPWEEVLRQRFWELIKEEGRSLPSLFDTQEMKNLWGPVDRNETQSPRIRALSQLVWGMEAKLKGLDQKPRKTILVWERYNWDLWWWRQSLTGTTPVSQMGCGFTENFTLTNCDFVQNRNRIRDVDAVLISADFPFGEDIKGLPENTLRFVYNTESPYRSSFKATRERDVVVTYWRGSDLVAPYSFWFYKDPKIKRVMPDRDYSRGKSKPVAAIISNCANKNGRLDYIRELKKHINVDVYGYCGNKYCGPSSRKQCYDLLKKDYYFYLAFENSNCRDYITEKLYWNAFNQYVVPIVMGAHPDDYKAMAPAHSYIHVEDYASPEDLALKLKSLIENPEMYNEYFAWKGTVDSTVRQEIVHFKRGASNSVFCQICAMLHYADIIPPPKRAVGFTWNIPNATTSGMCLSGGRWYWGRPN